MTAQRYRLKITAKWLWKTPNHCEHLNHDIIFKKEKSEANGDEVDPLPVKIIMASCHSKGQKAKTEHPTLFIRSPPIPTPSSSSFHFLLVSLFLHFSLSPWENLWNQRRYISEALRGKDETWGNSPHCAQNGTHGTAALRNTFFYITPHSSQKSNLRCLMNEVLESERYSWSCPIRTWGHPWSCQTPETNS